MKKRKFPEATYLNKKNAEYWGEKSGKDYSIKKKKGGYALKLK